MKYTITLLITPLLLMALVLPALADSKAKLPKLIPLPNGFQPEGIEIGREHEIFAGSLATGAIYRADLRTGQGGLIVPPQAGRIAVGLGFDQRTNYIFVAGGPAGAGYVYDAGSGAALASYQFTTEQSFVNDVVVTKAAAYFTDSSRSFLYRVPLGSGGQLPEPSVVTALPLTGDYAPVDGINANGIDATPNGKMLIIVQFATGKLYQVNPNSGQAILIDLGGGSVVNGDGILLDGKTLYVVQNFNNQVAVVQLNSKLTSGEIEHTITDPNFRVPTTDVQFENSLYVVNARFDTPPKPDTTYEIVRVNKEKEE
jgi:streptogramin lyase